jgi:hypothetical protein
MSKQSSVKLSAKWQLDAALLSRPVDLTPLVTLSKSSPDKFAEDDTLHRLVSILLNEKNSNKSDKDTKLDVLNILANVAAGSSEVVSMVKVALQGISEWFDEYIATEEADAGVEPELHKAMVLLLARCWDYKLKTEDILELTHGNRRIALCTIVGLLEDGETYSTVLKQRQKPDVGKMAQWEHELVIHRFERPLLLQICRLLRGFTHPGTYFEASGDEIALFSVERFAEEMNILLEITLRSRLVEKLCVAMYSCLFEVLEESGDEDGDASSPSQLLEESDHMAVVCVHAFLQNLYFYASHNNDEYRRHMLVDTMLIPRLILPYLDKCVKHAAILNKRAAAYSEALKNGREPSAADDAVASFALDQPQLVKGIAASLRTLVIASFRAPATQYVMSLLRRLNPTASMLKASAFVIRHEYIFALLCILNVNMGALDLSQPLGSGGHKTAEAYRADALLRELAKVYSQMSSEVQQRVHRRVLSSGALPVSRDTPSYVAVLSVLLGGAAGQLDYLGRNASSKDEEAGPSGDSAADPLSQTGMLEYDMWDSRAEAKKAQAERLAMAKQLGINVSSPADPSGGEKGSAASAEVVRRAESDGVAAAEPKAPSAFKVAVSVAQGTDAKEAKNAPAGSKTREEQIRGDNYRHLGDLPSLGGGSGKTKVRADDVSIPLNLEIRSKKSSSEAKSSAPAAPSGRGEIPQEFLCAINGHVMKEPMRATTSGTNYMNGQLFCL